MTQFEADWVCPAASPPVPNGVIAVHDGRIVEVTTAGACPPGVSRTRFPGCAIIPGFVNAHTHLELTLLRGLLEDLPFAEWIRRLIRLKYQVLEPDDWATSARLGAIECLAAGVTAVGEVMDNSGSWEAMRDFNLAGIAYQEVFGPASGTADSAVRGLEEKVNRCRDAVTPCRRVGVSPHAPYSVSAELYRAATGWARQRGLPLAMHIAESADEETFVREGKGPFAEALRGRGIDLHPDARSSIAYLERLGVLGPDALLIHAIRVDREDLDLMARYNSPVVHCPKSNAKLGHGIAPVQNLLSCGMRVSLGSDSVASNNAVDMFEEMRCAVYLQRVASGRPDVLSAESVFRMATLGGAMCLGLESEIGSLEAGKRADFVVVDLSGPATSPVFDPVTTMVFSACRKDVRRTYLGGVEAVIDREPFVKPTEVIRRKLIAAI